MEIFRKECCAGCSDCDLETILFLSVLIFVRNGDSRKTRPPERKICKKLQQGNFDQQWYPQLPEHGFGWTATLRLNRLSPPPKEPSVQILGGSCGGSLQNPEFLSFISNFYWLKLWMNTDWATVDPYCQTLDIDSRTNRIYCTRMPVSNIHPSARTSRPYIHSQVLHSAKRSRTNSSWWRGRWHYGQTVLFTSDDIFQICHAQRELSQHCKKDQEDLCWKQHAEKFLRQMMEAYWENKEFFRRLFWSTKWTENSVFSHLYLWSLGHIRERQVRWPFRSFLPLVHHSREHKGSFGCILNWKLLWTRLRKKKRYLCLFLSMPPRLKRQRRNRKQLPREATVLVVGCCSVWQWFKRHQEKPQKRRQIWLNSSIFAHSTKSRSVSLSTRDNTCLTFCSFLVGDKVLCFCGVLKMGFFFLVLSNFLISLPAVWGYMQTVEFVLLNVTDALEAAASLLTDCVKRCERLTQCRRTSSWYREQKLNFQDFGCLIDSLIR